MRGSQSLFGWHYLQHPSKVQIGGASDRVKPARYIVNIEQATEHNRNRKNCARYTQKKTKNHRCVIYVMSHLMVHLDQISVSCQGIRNLP